MIKVYKTRHNANLTEELVKAKVIANFAINNRDKLSTKFVKNIGLKSVISNQILRKYGRNKKIKLVHSAPLVISGHHVTFREGQLWIPALKLSVALKVGLKIKQVELDNHYVYAYHEVAEAPQFKIKTHIGVDLNTTGNCAVVAVKETGKVHRLGKKAEHIHKKYSRMRKHLQSKGLYGVVKKIKNRESRIVRDLNHKTSKFIVQTAVQQKGGLQLESLKGIRNSRKIRNSFKYALHSWSFRQLAMFIEYKALLAGVPITYVDPAYTSKSCSRCGLIGERDDKVFKCSCGHVEHADSNAAFNISVWSDTIAQSYKERVLQERNLAIRQKATVESN